MYFPAPCSHIWQQIAASGRLSPSCDPGHVRHALSPSVGDIAADGPLLELLAADAMGRAIRGPRDDTREALAEAVLADQRAVRAVGERDLARARSSIASTTRQVASASAAVRAVTLRVSDLLTAARGGMPPDRAPLPGPSQTPPPARKPSTLDARRVSDARNASETETGARRSIAGGRVPSESGGGAPTRAVLRAVAAFYPAKRGESQGGASKSPAGQGGAGSGALRRSGSTGGGSGAGAQTAKERLRGALRAASALAEGRSGLAARAGIARATRAPSRQSLGLVSLTE